MHMFVRNEREQLSRLMIWIYYTCLYSEKVDYLVVGSNMKLSVNRPRINVSFYKVKYWVYLGRANPRIWVAS